MRRTPSGLYRGPVSDLGDGDAPARGEFLAHPRAAVLCAREFDRLSDHLAATVTTGAATGHLTNADVRRAPGRCIVQLGPVALTVSWVRARVDTVADGRLLVIEWLGVVGRAPMVSTERPSPADVQRSGAKLLSEIVLRADALSERDWFWSDEAPPQVRYRSPDLAEHCAASLWATLQRVEGR